jgi:hypothetical protein
MKITIIIKISILILVLNLDLIKVINLQIIINKDQNSNLHNKKLANKLKKTLRLRKILHFLYKKI